MSAVTRDYCQRYAIKQISLELQSGVVDTADRVCHLELQFEVGYKVQFKLQGEQALLGDKLSLLRADGTVTCLAGADATGLESELESFFKSIAGRLQRILHEEDVQNIEYLGNTFELNGKTVFDVVADDDGRLTISMHRGAERQEAMLLASSLLDGLYDGSIRLLELR
jgi:hypothetical protein